MPLLMRRIGHACSNWQCLTTTEKFGIIFSVVLIFLVLSGIYMYCLGRACIVNHQREQISMTSRSKTSHNSAPELRPQSMTLVAMQPPANPPLGTPIAPNLIWVQPAILQTSFHPATCTIPRVQVSHPGTFGVLQGGQQQGCPASAVGQSSCGTPSPRISRRSRTRPHDGQGGWFQRLIRAFQIATGRASTVTSSSSLKSPRSIPATSNVACLKSGEHEVARRPRDEIGEESKAHAPSSATNTHCASMQVNEEVASDATSINTNAAMVHSDDFQLVDGRKHDPNGQTVEEDVSKNPDQKYEVGEQRHYVSKVSGTEVSASMVPNLIHSVSSNATNNWSLTSLEFQPRKNQPRIGNIVVGPRLRSTLGDLSAGFLHDNIIAKKQRMSSKVREARRREWEARLVEEQSTQAQMMELDSVDSPVSPCPLHLGQT